MVIVDEPVLRYKSYKIRIQMLSDVTTVPIIAARSTEPTVELGVVPKQNLALGKFYLWHKSMKWLQFQLIVKYTAVSFTCLLFLYFMYSTRSLTLP